MISIPGVGEFDLDQDTETLAEWWRILNSWQWPEDLPNKPYGFDDLEDFFPLDRQKRNTLFTKITFTLPVMNAIKSRIGTEVILEHCNVTKGKMSLSEFKQWYTREAPIFLDKT